MLNAAGDDFAYISEECFCRGFKLNRCSPGSLRKFDGDEKVTYEGPIRLVHECIGDFA
jgi:hypothetical protein